ncbi:MAG: hypothetical protein JSS20_14570 [Proteobacteria bacterium]|nr:hypothetical protein [Pseudomonadota bacterium]
MRFIPPAIPSRRLYAPSGPEWQHEPKLDGWRVQVHKVGTEVTLLSRRGLDITRRFNSVAVAAASLPATSVILDAEIVALGADGLPDFISLHHRAASSLLTLFAFDIMHLDGEDLLDRPLAERGKVLADQLARHGHSLVRRVESFDDGSALLAEAERIGLEGVVSKRRDAPYRSGTKCGWVKVKTAVWRQANARRGDLFRR